MKRTSTRKVLIGICLVSLSFILASFSAGVLPLFSLAKLPPSIAPSPTSTSLPSPPPPHFSQTGTLVIKTTLFGVNGSGNPIANAMVTVAAVNSGSPEYTLDTNSSGEVQMVIDAGNYTIQFSASEFHSATGTQVYGNRITEVVLVASDVDNQSLLSYRPGHAYGIADAAGRFVGLLPPRPLLNCGIFVAVPPVKDQYPSGTELVNEHRGC
jgi:hypothetical protein